MPGYNLQTYIDYFNQQVSQFQGKLSNPTSGPSSLIMSYLHESFRAIQAKTGIQVGRTATGSLVSGTSAYDIPAKVLGRQIDTVQVATSTSVSYSAGYDGLRTLRRKTMEWMRTSLELNNPTTGDPVYWAISDSDQRQIVIYPPPNYSTSAGGIVFAYRPQVTRLRRAYQSSVDSITASCTQAGVTITISSATPTTAGTKRIYAGDEIGIVTTSEPDGGTDSNITPSQWYPIDSVSGTTITLDSAFPYDDITASSLNFVTAQVSELETAFPGGLGWLPVYGALAFHYGARGEQDLAKTFGGMFDSGLDNLTVEERGVEIAGYKPMEYSTFHNA